jgi:hypothetical protein
MRRVVYHETKLALQDAQQNKVPKLLVAPLTALLSVLNTIVSKVNGKSLDSATLGSATARSARSRARPRAGSSITESIASASQLAAGFA